jgi:DNA-binding XRE family transcriptional regulator
MDSYDESVMQLQSEAQAALQADLAKAKQLQARDSLHAEYTLFLLQLIQARTKQHITQADLAKRLNMQQSAIARIESGRGNPSLRTLLAIAKALNADLMLEYKH